MGVSSRIAAASSIDDRHRRLVDRILDEEPGVASAPDDWQLAIALRSWAYRNIRRQTDYPTLLDQRPEFAFFSRDAADIFEAFAQDLGGVVGGGCGFALLRLYEAFGFESLMIDCGLAGSYTRISTLCNLGQDGNALWVVQDPNYDFALTTATGGPIDIREVVRLLRLRRHDAVLRSDGDPDASREIIMLPEQLSMLANEWTIDPTSVPLRTLPDGRAVFRSHMTMKRYVELAEGSSTFLRERNLPEDLIYFYLLIFAVYPAHLTHAIALFEEIKSLQTLTLETSASPHPTRTWSANPITTAEGEEPYEADEIDVDAYRRYGFFVVRNFFSTDERERLCATWQDFYGRSLRDRRDVGKNGASPQDLCEAPPSEIAELYRHPKLIELIRALYGNDIVFCQQRILIKDAHFRGGIPPHQDFSYYLGGMEKTGLFIPLTTCGPENGGLHFILASHKFGYLGDRGFIPHDRLVDGSIPGFRSVCPTLRLGDVALMDICLLHFSYEAINPDPRVYVNPYYQPATDGAYDTLIAGDWRTDFWWKDHEIMKYFKTNVEFYGEQLDRLQRREMR